MKPGVTAPTTGNQSSPQDLPLSSRDQQHLDAVSPHWNPRTPYVLPNREIDSNSNRAKSLDNHSPAFRTIDRHLARLSRQHRSFTELPQQARDQRSGGPKNKNSPNEPENDRSINNPATAA